MQQPEEKIIEELKKIFSLHQEPYEEGTWEVFRERYKIKKNTHSTKRRSLFFGEWKYAAAAAVIILIAILFPMNFKKSNLLDTTRYMTKEKDRLNFEKEHTTSDNIVVTKENLTHTEHISESNITTVVSQDKDSKKKKTSVPKVVKTSDQTEVLKSHLKPLIAEKTKYITNHTNGLISLHAANSIKQQTDSSSGDRWRFGLELSSSVVSKKINFGAGFLTEFNISDKLILGAGISYTQINVQNKWEPVILSPSLRQTGYRTVILSIDFPVSITYQTNNGIYASIGLSSFNILDENKAYKYEMDILSETVTLNPDTGAESVKYMKVTKEFTESTDDKDFKSVNSLNYLHLSLGKKKNFLDKKQIVFEPFVKVPIGGFSNKRPSLMSAGIKFKLLL